MGPLLTAHRGAVLGFFLTLLYAEFTHAVYRSAALAHFAIDAIEESRPLPKYGAE